MRDSALDVRLCSCADLVRQDAVFADIGTDHAYLPIFLLKSGRIKKAYCSDINKGPLATAAENVRDNGLCDRVELILTDGAAALSDKGITDYAICGMGGELIADIISKAPHLMDKNVRLILQPMTKHGHLRRYLFSEGFEIISESYSSDGRKNYVCFLVCYTGNKKTIDEVHAEITAKNTRIVNKNMQKRYFDEKRRAYEKIIEGKKVGGENARTEELILCEIEKILNEGE